MTLSSRGARSAAVLAIILALASPGVALAGNGKKAFKKGVEFEESERWDLAAEQFAVAYADEPANTEYRLHYARAIANASVLLTQRGDRLAEQKDYAAAYQAYRQAFSYDATNELAGEKMRYMLKLQGITPPPEGPEKDLVRAKYERDQARLEVPRSRKIQTDVIYHATPLRQIIDSLADSLGLNVIYDSDIQDATLKKAIDLELRNVTKASALELVLNTNKFFYVQADTRTIIIAADQPQNRARYQKLAVKTFYLRNTDAADVRTLIQQVVATKYLVNNKQQNSLTVRDTPANLELIQSIIASIDKDRAEVLIEVNLYEVDHTDLLTFGNQFATSATASNSGLQAPGFQSGFGGLGVAGVFREAAPVGVYGPLGLALALPTSTLTAFQNKSRSKLLASTQVHVLDGEQHTIRIGSRVPIQTATYQGFGGTTVIDNGGRNGNNGNNNNLNNGIGNIGLSTPATSYQYENVGLNIDMQPTVHEDMVQIKMKVETSDVGPPGVGGNPTFTQRQMSSVAGIRNGQTTLVAGVAQQNESNGRSGIPLLSLLPGVGRLFSTPTRDNRVTDVVITITPHILRAPVYTEEDNEPIGAGTATAPDRQVGLEEILYRAELDEAAQAAPIAGGAPPGAARPGPPGSRPASTDVQFQVPGAPESPAVNRPVSSRPGETISTPSGRAPAPIVQPEDRAPTAPPSAVAPRPVPVSPGPQQTPQVQPAPAQDDQDDMDDEDDDDSDESDEDDPGGASAKAAVPVRSEQAVAAAGATAAKSAAASTAQPASGEVSVRLAGLQTGSVNRPMPVAVFASGDSNLTSATLAIKFDESILRVNRVESTGMFDGKLGARLPFEVKDGVLYVTLARPADRAGQPVSGQLANITFDVIGAGTATLSVVPDASKVTAPDDVVAEVRFDNPLVVTTR